MEQISSKHLVIEFFICTEKQSPFYKQLEIDLKNVRFLKKNNYEPLKKELDITFL